MFFSLPKRSRLLCSARGRAIGTNIATPEVQANVLHLRILNRRQGKVPLGCPGNHASQHALCEWQEEGVTEWELCVNGHLASWTSSEAFFCSLTAPDCATVHPSRFLKTVLLSSTIVSVLYSCSVRAERRNLQICHNYLVPCVVKFLFSGKRRANSMTLAATSFCCWGEWAG